MALDSAQKRFAVAGNVFPVAAKDGPWRITVGNAYPVAALAAAVLDSSLNVIRSVGQSVVKSVRDIPG